MTGDFLSDYGVLLLTKIPPKSLWWLDLPTRMERKCLICEFTLNNEEVTVATVHLESMNSRPFRKLQLQKMHEAFSDKKNVILVGDMNTDAYINYDQLVKKVRPSFLG
jgi:endonuclease/exonuclease/phosphatase family metal-dependent hydrolase